MPFVEITMIEGRMNAQKADLIGKVTDAIVDSVGAPIESIRVVIREVPGAH
jgi:4-oxalocrotonate tautomerase